MTEPDGDGWVPWPEDETDAPRSPDLGDLEEGEAIESHYDYDATRLNRAWSRKVKIADSDGFSFSCRGCGQFLLVVAGSPPFPPYQTTTKQITCSACGETHGYVGQMVRISGSVSVSEKRA